MEETGGTSTHPSTDAIVQTNNKVKGRQLREKKKCQEFDRIGIDFEYDHHHSKTKCYKQKFNIYNFLNNPQGLWARIYHIVVFIIVFVCVIATLFINDDISPAWIFLYLFEQIIILLFSIEFLLRLWSSSCKRKYEGWKGKLHYMSKPAHVLEVIIILVAVTSNWVVLGLNDGSEVFAMYTLQVFHRFFKVLQIMTFNRQLQPWKVLFSVIYDQREQLIVIFYIEFILLSVLAYITYIVEKNENQEFGTISSAMWWFINFQAVLGISMFALPAGVIGTGLAIKVTEEQKAWDRSQKKMPAVVLIQCWWRCYAANPKSLSIATWTTYRPQYDMISKKERNAIRFIRMVKFLLAKHSFQTQRKQTDARDVLEQYRVGHSSILYHIKEIQSDLSHLMANVQTNSQIQESTTDLLERIQTLEKTQNDFNTKINTTFEQLFDKIEILSKHNNDRHKCSKSSDKTSISTSSSSVNKDNSDTE